MPAKRTSRVNMAVRARVWAEACRRGICIALPCLVQRFILKVQQEIAVSTFQGFCGGVLFPNAKPTRQQHCHLQALRLPRDDHLHLHLLHALSCSHFSSPQRLSTLYAGMSHCAGRADSFLPSCITVCSLLYGKLSCWCDVVIAGCSTVYRSLLLRDCGVVLHRRWNAVSTGRGFGALGSRLSSTVLLPRCRWYGFIFLIFCLDRTIAYIGLLQHM